MTAHDDCAACPGPQSFMEMRQDLRAVKSASDEVKAGLALIYQVLERITALEERNHGHTRDQERIERSIEELFRLHRELSASVATLVANVGTNSRSGDRWMTLAFGIAAAVGTLLFERLLK